MVFEVQSSDVLDVAAEGFDPLADFRSEAHGREHGEGARGELDYFTQGGLGRVQPCPLSSSGWNARAQICKGVLTKCASAAEAQDSKSREW